MSEGDLEGQDLEGQVLQSRISALLLGPFELPTHRRIMHSQVRRDLVEPITMLLVCPLQR